MKVKMSSTETMDGDEAGVDGKCFLFDAPGSPGPDFCGSSGFSEADAADA